MFARCCDRHSTIDYTIVHNPQPLPLSIEMDTMIKKLLWYVPNIDSQQAKKNDLISDKIYDDFSFKYIMDQMGMVENRDVKWIETKTIDDDDWNYYEKQICNKMLEKLYCTWSFCHSR